MASDNNRAFLDLLREITEAIQKGDLLDIYDFSDILRDYHFRSSAELGVAKPPLSGLAEQASAYEDFAPAPAESRFPVQVAIAELGCPAERRGREQALMKLADQMARSLASASDGDLLLRAECAPTPEGGLNTRFILGAERLTQEALLGLVRGVYGRVQAVAVSPGAAHRFTCYARAKMILRSKQELMKEDPSRAAASWIDAVLRSVACDKRYSVELRFHPVIDQELETLEAHLDTLQGLYEQLAYYSETGWSNTVNTGENLTGARSNFLKELVKGIKVKFDGFTQIGATFGTNYSLSTKEISKLAQGLMEELDFEIYRLRQALNTLPWLVTIAVSADLEPTLDSVTATLSGMLEHANLSLAWTTSETTACIVSGRSLRPLLAFPQNTFPGFELVELEDHSLVSPSADKDSISMGQILWNGEPVSEFRLSRDVLNRHAFICGMTGAGKTNTLFKIMEAVAVPFLVIEPVKGEYRSLKATYPDVEVWTMRASDSVSDEVHVLQINPFWFPPGTSLSFHIDSIKTILSSAFDLYAAMPNIVEQCLYNVYIKAGWNLITNQNLYAGSLPDEYLYPTFTDLTNEVEDYLNHSDFGDEVLGNYKGALLSRLKSFLNGSKGILLNTGRHPDYARLVHGRSIIELEGLADDADKCLVMGTILVQYYQYLKHHFDDSDGKNQLKHLIVIEEAHRLFKNIRNTGKSEGPNPTGQLVDSLSNIMAEIRAFGEGLLIVDQSPTKIAADVIKNSATKIIHRIDNGEDIKLLRSALLLDENDKSLPSLRQGETMIRTDGMRKACKVKVRKAEQKERYALANSFGTGTGADLAMQDIFHATAILQNSSIVLQVQEEIYVLVQSMALSDWEDWYEFTNQFLLHIYPILQESHQLDAFGRRMNGIFEVVSQVLLRSYNSVSRLQSGTIHMSVMRLLALYLDAKKQYKVKAGVSALMKAFVAEHFTADTVFHIAREAAGRSEFLQLCAVLELNPDSVFAYLMYDFIEASIPLLQKDPSLRTPSRDQVKRAFFHMQTYLDETRYASLDPYFDRAARWLSQPQLWQSGHLNGENQ